MYFPQQKKVDKAEISILNLHCTIQQTMRFSSKHIHEVERFIK